MEVRVELVARNAVPLKPELRGKRRFELVCDGGERTGELAVLTGEFDVVEHWNQRIDGVGLAEAAGGSLLLPGALHKQVEALLGVVDVCLGASELILQVEQHLQAGAVDERHAGQVDRQLRRSAAWGRGRRRNLQSRWSLPTALAFLAWFVFAPQCLSTIAVARRETNGWKWPLFMVAYLFGLAYVFAGITYWTAKAFGL